MVRYRQTLNEQDNVSGDASGHNSAEEIITCIEKAKAVRAYVNFREYSHSAGFRACQA